MQLARGHGNRRLVIIGAGVIGQSHALVARDAGWHVTVLERDGTGVI